MPRSPTPRGGTTSEVNDEHFASVFNLDEPLADTMKSPRALGVPREPHIGVLFQTGETEVFSRDVTSSVAVEVGAGILRGLPVAWSEIGVADGELEGLAEILMRLFVSFLQYPADPPRPEDELRALVRRWLGLALEAKPSRPRR